MISGFYIYIKLINYPALSKAEDKARPHSLMLSPILFNSELVLSDFSPLLLCLPHFYSFYSQPLNVPIKGFVPLVILSNPFSLGRSYLMYFIFPKPPKQIGWKERSSFLWKEFRAPSQTDNNQSRGTLCHLSSAKSLATCLLFLESERKVSTLHNRGKQFGIRTESSSS